MYYFYVKDIIHYILKWFFTPVLKEKDNKTPLIDNIEEEKDAVKENEETQDSSTIKKLITTNL